MSDVGAVAARMEQLLRERPRTFYALVRELGDAEYRVILQAWGSLREARRLGRDEHGLYLLRQTSGVRARTSRPTSRPPSAGPAEDEFDTSNG